MLISTFIRSDPYSQSDLPNTSYSHSKYEHSDGEVLRVSLSKPTTGNAFHKQWSHKLQESYKSVTFKSYDQFLSWISVRTLDWKKQFAEVTQEANTANFSSAEASLFGLEISSTASAKKWNVLSISDFTLYQVKRDMSIIALDGVRTNTTPLIYSTMEKNASLKDSLVMSNGVWEKGDVLVVMNKELSQYTNQDPERVFQELLLLHSNFSEKLLQLSFHQWIELQRDLYGLAYGKRAECVVVSL
jgi:hypothetical protein